MRALLAAALLLAACDCKPATPDGGCHDQAEAADLSAPPVDPSCIRCDAVNNPCPALGRFCAPATGCCDTEPHVLRSR